MFDDKTKQRKTFYHHWIMAEAYLLIHRSTGLKVLCEPKEAPADDPNDNWHAYIIDLHADRLRLAAEAAQDGTDVAEYTEYLARAVMELIDDFVKGARKEKSQER